MINGSSYGFTANTIFSGQLSKTLFTEVFTDLCLL